MKFLWVSFCLFLLSGCSFYRPPLWVDISDGIEKQYVADMNKIGFVLCAFGGSMAEDVERVNLHFMCKGVPNVEMARALFALAMQDLTARYNECAEIRPYLHNFPFNHTNVKMGMFFKMPLEDKLKEEVVVYMFNLGDNVYYHAYDPDNVNNLKCIHEELYPEALKALKKNYPSGCFDGHPIKEMSEMNIESTKKR